MFKLNKFLRNPEHHFAGSAKDQFALLYQRGWRHPKGHKLSPERIEALRKINKGKIIPQEMRDHLRKINLGKKHSPEIRKKISANRMGVPVKEEARIKIAASKQGQKNWNTRLTEKDILKIRKLSGNADSKPKGKRVKLGKYTIAEIAEMFGISPVHVINIRRKKVWKHI